MVAFEHPAIQTVFNVRYETVQELPPGNAATIKRNSEVALRGTLTPIECKACSSERIYFPRGSGRDTHRERKTLGKLLYTRIAQTTDNNLKDTIFAHMSSTAETAYLGLIGETENQLNPQELEQLA